MASVAVVPSVGENIASVLFALARLGIDATLTADAAAIAAADRVILMGVGAALPAMAMLRQAGLIDCVRRLRQPVFGICVGMQILFERSEEAETECLGIIPGRVRLIPARPPLVTVPHMGWNGLRLARPDSPLVRHIADGDDVYFANSYYVPESAATVASVDHGVTLSALVSHGNFHGCQFHPERSGAVGRRILENFMALS